MEEIKKRVKQKVYEKIEADRKKRGMYSGIASITAVFIVISAGILINDRVVRNENLLVMNEYNYYYYTDKENAEYDYLLSFSKDKEEQSSYMEIIESDSKFKSISGL